MFIVGAIQGPLHHYFYLWIDGAIRTVNLVNVTKKILLDQCLMSPVFILAFFYPAGWLAGQTIRQCNDEVKDKFVKVYMVSCDSHCFYYVFFYIKFKMGAVTDGLAGVARSSIF